MEKKKIWLSSPHMGGEEIKFVKEAFDTNWISPVGPHISAFESELAGYNGVDHCAVLSSGTAAIHLALIILGVRAGDEVICSSFTFSGSCNPIVYQGATPVFIDSELETWNMDPALLEMAIQDRMQKTGKKPKAIILVHLYGMPANMGAIMNIARAHGIPVVEDAAEALGSSYQGKKLGTSGDFGVYSFNGNKIITTSGGGALVSMNGDWIAKARFLATQARDPAPHYEHSELGFNYRMSNVVAGIGRGQMRVLDERVVGRRAVYQWYTDRFRNHLHFLPEPAGSFSNRWLTTATLPGHGPSPERVREALENQNIESRPLWKPMHLQPFFSRYPAYVSGASETLFNRGICLPSGTNMDQSDLDRIEETLQLVFAGSDR